MDISDLLMKARLPNLTRSGDRGRMRCNAGSDIMHPVAMDISRSNSVSALQLRYAMRLAGWAAASMIAGLLLWFVLPSITRLSIRAFAEALAAQCVLWGVIDAAIAAAGLHRAQKRSRRPAQHGGEISGSELERTVRLRRFMIKLDWMWLAVGAALLVTGVIIGSGTSLGHGVGLIIQSGFLLVVDRDFMSRIETR